MEPFVPITEEDKKFNIPSGLLSFSDAHYFDVKQDYGKEKDLSKNIIDKKKLNVLSSGNDLRILNSDTSILAASGLNFQNAVGSYSKQSIFSNGPKSKDLSITDFNIFNPYIHYVPNKPQENVLSDAIDPLAIKIDTSSFLNKSVNAFNVYGKSSR